MATRRANGQISFNEYLAGPKIYRNGSTAATIGPVDKSGYKERDMRNRVKRNALLQYAQDMQAGKFGAPNFLRKAR